MLSSIFVTVCGPFEWKRICAGLFLSFVYKCIVVDDPDIKRGFGIPLNGLTPLHLCAYPKPGPRFPMSYVVGFCVQWVNVCCYCSLCWYWWNCLPSLFNLNFHNFIGYMHVVYNYDIQYYWKICLWCLKSLSTIFQLCRDGLLKGYKKGTEFIIWK